jgi:cGMP-dependent protein kinase 2
MLLAKSARSSPTFRVLYEACSAGMLNGRARDIKQHAWFEGLDWEELEARRLEMPRRPKDDSAKRIQELHEAEAAEERPEEDPAELAECDLVFADF